MQENEEIWVQSLGGEDPPEEGMATHFSVLSWRIPRTEESVRLQSKRSQRVRHSLATKQQYSMIQENEFSCMEFYFGYTIMYVQIYNIHQIVSAIKN